MVLPNPFAKAPHVVIPEDITARLHQDGTLTLRMIDGQAHAHLLWNMNDIEKREQRSAMADTPQRAVSRLLGEL